MKATIRSRHLIAAMRHSLAARSGVLPVLQHALVEAKAEEIAITTTDLETYCTATIPALVQETGFALVEASKFAAAAAAGDELRLDILPDDRLRVRGSERNVLRISTLPWRDFPQLDDDQFEPLTIDPVALKNAIESVLYVAPQQDVRTFLNSVHVHKGFVEAADGKQIARAPCAFDGRALLLPSARAPRIAGLLAEGCSVHAAYAKDGRARMLRVRGSAADEVSISLTTLMMSGDYPDLASLVRTFREPEFSAQVLRSEFKRASKALFPFTASSGQSKLHLVDLSFSEADGLRLRAANDCEMALPSASKAEGDLQISVRLDVLAKALEAEDSELVEIAVVRQTQNATQAVLRLTSDGGASHYTVECVQ